MLHWINNLSYYLMRVIQDYLIILGDIDQITPYKYEKYLSISQIQDTLEERIDDSVFPIYFKKDTNENKALREKLIPTFKQFAIGISAAVRLLFALKVDTKNVGALLDELNSIQGTQWSILADFVKNDCKKINFKSGGDDSIVPDSMLYGSLAIAAKLSNSPKEVKDSIAEETSKALQNFSESLKLEELPEVFKKHNEQQIQSLNNAKEMILKLLK